VAIYVNNDNSLQLGQTISRDCPHCGAHAQLLPLATPSFDAVASARPRNVGIVFRCAACSEPRFLRAAVRAFGPDRIELAAGLAEVERARERFNFSYLPPTVEPLFREALECFSAACYNAFASMCRRAIQASQADVGRNDRQRWQALYRDVVTIGEIDEPTAQTLEAVLFGIDAHPPALSRDEAGVLIEIVRDMMYQRYVRTAKLRAAMRMRRYFAGESARNITPLDRSERRAESA
jgi:hypothetical protein